MFLTHSAIVPSVGIRPPDKMTTNISELACPSIFLNELKFGDGGCTLKISCYLRDFLLTFTRSHRRPVMYEPDGLFMLSTMSHDRLGLPGHVRFDEHSGKLGCSS